MSDIPPNYGIEIGGQNTRSLINDLVAPQDRLPFMDFLGDPRNKKLIIDYSNISLTRTIQYAPEALLKGIRYETVDPNLWLTSIVEGPNGLSFNFGKLKFTNFPKPLRSPGVHSLNEFARSHNIDANVPSRNLFSDTDTRWFNLGSVYYKIAGLNLPEISSVEISFLHLACFVWGSIAHEKFLKEQIRYWQGTHNTQEVIKRIGYPVDYYPYSGVPIGSILKKKDQLTLDSL